MNTFCKEITKLIRSKKFFAWKKRIELALKENEFMEHVLGEEFVPGKEKIEELENYKGEALSQRIIVESIKDHLVPFVVDLKTSKNMYDTLVKLYSISTSSQNIYEEYIEEEIKRVKKWKLIL